MQNSRNDTSEQNHAREQAKAQLESIVEMVAALDREQAAELFVRDLERDEIINLLAGLDDDSEDEERDEAQKAYETEETETLRERLASEIADETVEPDDFSFDEDEARETIQEDALSVEVRTDWYTPGEEATPSEFMILLCTGGPAVRIVGDLDQYKQPDRARIEYQDWGTPWTELVDITSGERAALLTYAQQFYFGE